MLLETSPLSIDMLEKALSIAVKYLTDLYARSVAINEDYTHPNSEYYANENGILGKVLDIISKHSEQALTVPELASRCNCSESYLNHLFKSSTGTSNSISEISSHVGFNDPDYFAKVFTSNTGQPPSSFRKLFTSGIAVSDVN